VLRKQVFKTWAGAQKRAAFETAHCGGRWNYVAVRCIDGERDTAEFNVLRFSKYTWQLWRAKR
jgi:hypothetical protein